MKVAVSRPSRATCIKVTAQQSPKPSVGKAALIGATAAVLLLTGGVGPSSADSRRLNGFFDALAHSPELYGGIRGEYRKPFGSSSSSEPRLPTASNLPGTEDVARATKETAGKAKGAAKDLASNVQSGVSSLTK